MTTAMPADDNILVASKVTMRFGGLVANKDVDFAIPRRGIVSLIGPNGAGKTTFFNQLTGMLEPTIGDIVFDGTSTVGRTPHEIVELGVARTFQNIRLFGDMTTLENIMVGRHVRMRAHWWDSVVRTPATRVEEAATAARARELLDIVGLPRRYEE
jgi:branched-chain amino acid transport system ATP-binding protein